MERVRASIGQHLRRARLKAGLSLRAVDERSHGVFKASAVGGYERGERSITLERFCELCRLYEAAPDRVVHGICSEDISRTGPDSSSRVAVDVDRLARMDGEEARVVADYVRRVVTLRGGRDGDTLTLRNEDLDRIAERIGLAPKVLLDQMVPAVQLTESAV